MVAIIANLATVSNELKAMLVAPALVGPIASRCLLSEIAFANSKLGSSCHPVIPKEPRIG